MVIPLQRWSLTRRGSGSKDHPRKKLARSLAALDRLDRFRERMAVEHPKTLEGPDAATAVRLERGRDDSSRS